MLLGQKLTVLRLLRQLIIEDLLLFGNLSLLRFDDIIIFFAIGLAAVDRFFLNRKIMLLADVNEHIPADRIEGHFPIVILAGLLIGFRPGNTHCFQSLFLSRLDFPVLIHHIEDMPFMHMRGRFVQMKRPVNDVHMLPEAFIEAVMIIIEHFQQNVRRGLAAFFPDLVDRFFRTGTLVSQQIIR